MADNQTSVTPGQGFRVLKAIWFMMVAAIGVLAIAVRLLPAGSSDAGSGGTAALLLGLVSGVLFLLQLKLYRNLADNTLFPRVLDLDSWGLGKEAASRLKELKVPERGEQLILHAHVIFGIITWALAEIMAGLGFLLALLTGEGVFMAISGAMALGTLLYFRPRGTVFEKQLERWRRYVESHREPVSGV